MSVGEVFIFSLLPFKYYFPILFYSSFIKPKKKSKMERERRGQEESHGGERVRKRYHKKIGVKYFFNKVESYNSSSIVESYCSI